MATRHQFRDATAVTLAGLAVALKRTAFRVDRKLVPHDGARLEHERRIFAGRNRDIVVHDAPRSEEHMSELQSLMRISYAVFCLKKKKKINIKHYKPNSTHI